MKPDVKKFLKQFKTTGFKNGDLVLVAEVMRVTNVRWPGKGMEAVNVEEDCIHCKPKECCHARIVRTGGYGQQFIMKLL